LTTNSKNLTLLDQGKSMYIFSIHLQNLFFFSFCQSGFSTSLTESFDPASPLTS